MTEQLRKLVRVNPREVWANEATNFTPWLRDNIDFLAEAVGIDIQLVESEVSVGNFSVDLVGEETGQSRPVIIENQLERTNHTHLGQLLTYAAGKDGGVIIWVSPEIRPEHRNALEWLNDATLGNLIFFGVELEVLQIEGSGLKAPNFKVVVGPKAEPVKNKGNALHPPGAPNELRKSYQTHFQSLLNKIKERLPGITARESAGFRNWISFTSGRAGFGFSLDFALRNKFRIAVYIDSGNKASNKRAFDLLEAKRQEIECQLGATLDWDRLNQRRACRISWYYDRQVTVMESDERLEELKDWTVTSFLKFREVMLPYIHNLEISADDNFDEESDELE